MSSSAECDEDGGFDLARSIAADTDCRTLGRTKRDSAVEIDANIAATAEVNGFTALWHAAGVLRAKAIIRSVRWEQAFTKATGGSIPVVWGRRNGPCMQRAWSH